MSHQNQKNENAFLNLLFNIIIPVFILNKIGRFTGPLPALILALTFPIAYGVYDLFKRKKVNAFSILGLLNVGLTGGLAVLGLHGIWFSIKEAAFPALVGLFVLGSSFTRKPFIETLFLNPTMIKVDILEEKLRANNKQTEFHLHLKQATQLLSLSFAASAIINFALAQRIFTAIDPSLTPEAQSLVLNEQIAQMTTWSMAVIVLPSMIFMLCIFWFLLRGIKKIANISMDDLFHESK